MHAVDHLQPCQSGVADLGVLEALGNNADDLTAGGHRGIGYHSHQADRTAAVDQPDAAFGQRLAQILGRLSVDWIMASTGAAEHAYRTQGHHRLRQVERQAA